MDFREVLSFLVLGFVTSNYNRAVVRIVFGCRFVGDNEWSIGARRVKFDKEVELKRGTLPVWNIAGRWAAANMAAMRNCDVMSDKCDV